MNDLNSVYLVGRVAETPVCTDKYMTFDLINTQYSYDESTQEYKQETPVVFPVAFVMTRSVPNIKIVKGSRIGVNGRMVINKQFGEKTVSIVCYTVQNLSPAVPL